jgi:hypothetical protein
VPPKATPSITKTSEQKSQAATSGGDAKPTSTSTS